MIKKLLPLIALLTSTVFSFTNFYGIAYVIAIYFAIGVVHFSKTFSTTFARAVLSSLILASSIMLAGLAAWFMRVGVHPLMVLGVFSIILLAFKKSRPENVALNTFVDRGDVISIALALVAPLIILVSFQLPNPSHAATYQFANNAWDNSSHALMLETASLENGYVYGRYSEVKEKTITRFNAYPQAWHLATANVMNGFGANLFDPSNQVLVMYSYLGAVFAWYFASVYCFSKLSWRLLEALKGRLTNNRPVLALDIVLFSIGNLLIQLVFYWGMLTSGFANYIGCATYLLIMAAMIIDQNDNNRPASYMLALIAGTSATLTWLLPSPAIVLSIVLGFLLVKHGEDKGLAASAWTALKTSRDKWMLSAATVFLIVVILAQVAIFVVYSQISGADQLNEGRLGGAFSVSQLMLLFLAIFNMFFWTRSKSSVNDLVQKLSAIAGPILLLTLAIYVYQIFTSGEISYYFGKSAGLALAMVGVFFVPAFTLLMSRYRASSLAIITLSASVAGVLVFGTNQSVISFTKLFQEKSFVSIGTAQEVVSYLEDRDPKKTKLIVLRDKKVEEDYNGNFASKLPHLPMTCAYSTVNISTSRSLKAKLSNLDKCAVALKDITLLVVTSDKTESTVRALNRPNIEIVNVP